MNRIILTILTVIMLSGCTHFYSLPSESSRKIQSHGSVIRSNGEITFLLSVDGKPLGVNLDQERDGIKVLDSLNKLGGCILIVDKKEKAKYAISPPDEIMSTKEFKEWKKRIKKSEQSPGTYSSKAADGLTENAQE